MVHFSIREMLEGTVRSTGDAIGVLLVQPSRTGNLEIGWNASMSEKPVNVSVYLGGAARHLLAPWAREAASYAQTHWDVTVQMSWKTCFALYSRPR